MAEKRLKRATEVLNSGISRRRVLQTSFAGGFTLSVLPALSAGRTLAAKAAASGSVKPFEFDEATISDLQRRMKSREISAHSLTKAYLDRINEVDENGPAINSVIEVNPEALSIADALDKEHEEKGLRGPMHGIPVLIKDNIDTADQMQTTAGSLALVGSKPAQDSA